MDSSIFAVKFQVLGRTYTVRVIARLAGQSFQPARQALLREHPDFKQATVTMIGCEQLGPQVEKVDDV